VICADELGPVIPRAFPPAPGWSVDGHRVKAELGYGRGPDKTWVFGALRPVDGHVVTLTGPSRNSPGYQRLLAKVAAANPTGQVVVVTDNLSTHSNWSTRHWLAERPRIRQVFIPKGACWLNLQERWWRLFRPKTLTKVSFAEITLATEVATAQLNARAAHGSGVGRRRHATDDASSSTASNERSTGVLSCEVVFADVAGVAKPRGNRRAPRSSGSRITSGSAAATWVARRPQPGSEVAAGRTAPSRECPRPACAWRWKRSAAAPT
jgi:transposase